MSQFITEHMVKQFSSNVWHLAQQKSSRLRAIVRSETLNGEVGFYDNYSPTEVLEKVGRHSDTEFTQVIHGRRRVTMSDYAWADLIDKEDKLRLIHDPQSQYAMAAQMAFGRKIDDIIIAGALGTAYSGKEGNQAVILPNSQKIGAFDGSASSGLNLRTLRAIKKKFNQSEIDMEPMYIICEAEQIDNLLGETELVNADYANVKALVNGEINTFMGFNFIRLERLPVTTAVTQFDAATGAVGVGADSVAAGSRRIIACAGSGLLLALGSEVQGKIDPRPDKHYATQVYASMTMGATRMEESKVIEVLCKE
jgi:hypothetical protein